MNNDITKHTVERFDYLTVKDCGYRVVALPSGGKSDSAPTSAVLALYCDTFDANGNQQGDRLVDFLKDEQGRILTAAWASAAARLGSARTYNRIVESAYRDFRYFLREGEGIPEEAKRPIAVRNLVDLARQTLATARKCKPREIGIEEVVPLAKSIDPALAPWINDDGSFKPESKSAKKTAAKK